MTNIFPQGLESADNNVLHMRIVHNTDFNHLIENLHMKFDVKSQLNIHLCHCLLLSLVRLVLEMDVQPT